jgi:glutaredoxin
MQLILYTRRDCHLCAEMRRELYGLEEGLGFTVESVDIDGDPDLVERYGHKVPVLVGGGEEICHSFLDEPQLHEYLSRSR